MNRCYRLVWSDTAGALVAVAEFVRAQGRRAAAGAMLCLAGSAVAGAPSPTQLPTGGTPRAGHVAVSTDGARMDVVQTTSRAVVDWRTFDVGRDATVNFRLPDAGSVVLNRVLDTQPSQIFGRVSANGQVFLSNPNGVYFSPTARVEVGGLVATSARIGDADFMNARLRLDGAGGGDVVNAGQLTAAPGGYVALLGSQVRNDGAIVAQLGTVALASGNAYELVFSGQRALGGVRVTPGQYAALVENGGAIQAAGGLVVLSAQAANAVQGSVVQTTGSIEATGLVATPGGRIVLESSQDIRVSGRVSVAGPAAGGDVRADAGRRLDVDSALVDASGDRGGRVVLTGRDVDLAGATAVLARGATGGGSIRVGGGYQGRDASVRNARTTRIGAQTTLRGDADVSGNGGEVVVWSDGATLFEGGIGARGGAASGDGGRVEVSGREWLGFRGRVDAGAAHGTGGTLLLDPKNLTVSNAAATDGLDSSGALAFGSNPSGNSVINPATITAVTNTGTAVTLQASNDLSVEANIISANPSGTGGAIELLAGRSVTINALINTDGGDLHVTANAPGADPAHRDAGPANLTNNGIIVASGGNVHLAIGEPAAQAGASGSIATGAVIARTLTVRHWGPTAGGTIDLGPTDVSQLAVETNAARNITNSFGDITVQGGPAGSTASFDAAGGDITLNGASNDFDFLQVAGRHVTVNDLNSIRLKASTITGDLSLTSHGPIESVGTIAVAGQTVLDARPAVFGVVAPDITLAGPHAFLGPVRVVSANDVLIRNLGDLVLGGGATTVDGLFEAESVSGRLDVTAPVLAARNVTLKASGSATFGASVGSSDNSLIVTAGGDITAAGLSAPRGIFLEAEGHVAAGPVTTVSVEVRAGLAGDVTLTSPANDFDEVIVSRGRNADIVNSQATSIGSASLAGDLAVRSNGSIDAGTLEVAGNALFTVQAPGSDLLLGDGGNLFGGTVTMATAGGGSYRDLSFSDGGLLARVPSGFPASGLRDVTFSFPAAPAFAVPAMSIAGNLAVSLPAGTSAGGITQAGRIQISPPPACSPAPCDPVWKGASFSTSTDADVVMTDAANELMGLKVAGGRNVALRSNGFLNLGDIDLAGDLSVTTTGFVFQSGPASVDGVASFAVGSNDLRLDHAGNAWNRVRLSARNVVLATTSDLTFGGSNLSGNLRLEVPDAFAAADGAPPVDLSSGNEAVTVLGPATFRNFDRIALDDPGLRFGPLAIESLVAPTSVVIREDDDVTQAAAWELPGTVVRAIADGGHSVLLANAGNRFGDVGLSGRIVALTENDDITQAIAGPVWASTSTTTLNAQGHAIELRNPSNVFGPLAIAGGASTVALHANADVTQAAAWALPATTVTVDAGSHGVILDRSGNRLGPLAVRAGQATVVEDDAVVQSAPWAVPGVATVRSGSDDIDLSDPANDFGALSLHTPANARAADANSLILGASNVAGRWSVSAAGDVGQSAALVVGTVDVASGAQVRLDRADNAIVRIGNVTAASGIDLHGGVGGLEIDGAVRTTGGDVLVRTGGGNLTMNAGSRVEVLGGGDAVLVAGNGFDFINLNSGGIPAVLVDTGRFLIYTKSRTATVKGNLSAGESTGVTFTANPPASIAGTDSRFLYADQNMLTVTALSLSRYYGDPNPELAFSVAGFLGSDTAANTLFGTPLLTTSATTGSGVGTYAINVLAGSLSNAKGYGYTMVDSTLDVLPRPVNLVGGRIHDGSIAVDPVTLRIEGGVGADVLALAGTAALADARVGLGKPLDVSGLALLDGAGGPAPNYTLAGGRHRYNVLSPITGLPTDAPLPRPEPPPTREFPISDFRNLAGKDEVDAKLVAAFGAFMMPGDLVPVPVEQTAPVALVAEVTTRAAPQEPVPPVEAAPLVAEALPEVRVASLKAPSETALPRALPRQGITIVFGADEAFAHGRAELTPSGRLLIEREIVSPIRSGYPVGSLFITGHTDPTGSDAFNERLSRRRAEAGRKYLVSRGIDARTIRSEGRGSRKPIAGLQCPPSDIACLGPERRIEIHLSPRSAASGASAR